MSVEEALARILASVPGPLEAEPVSLAEARGRTLARDLVARRNQPPAPVSAMDGYAVRAVDIAAPPVSLQVIGMSAAGHPFEGGVTPGTAVRIFTGAIVPPGADTILMQENAEAVAGRVTALQAEPVGRHIRKEGLDFREGEIGLSAGRRLGASELALAAAMNHAELPVARRPRVAILATGDELVPPGTLPGPAQIVASNAYALRCIVEAAGGTVVDLGIAADTMDALDTSVRAATAARADVLLTLGGASVGDHDLVQRALLGLGLQLGFWRVAMKPGKPLMHGRLGSMQVLGLPGNPVSSIVCGVLFVRALVRALSGDPAAGASITEPARLGTDLRVNEGRQDYMRAILQPVDGDLPAVSPAEVQDSSMLKVLAGAQCLIVRPPHAPAARAGERCTIIRLDRFLG